LCALSLDAGDQSDQRSLGVNIIQVQEPDEPHILKEVADHSKDRGSHLVSIAGVSGVSAAAAA